MSPERRECLDRLTAAMNNATSPEQREAIIQMRFYIYSGTVVGSIDSMIYTLVNTCFPPVSDSLLTKV